ncbi:transcriptional regulator, LysR family [Azomonas agilis]|uniref:Transcriptional regulator, LysR family n=1 Tax=Azomonas agilis TaxID=116849 RepID=A0A562J1X2_9GAMM|nr:LysR family transcriptional regulator [Azomonas agilis]TWH77117.1 transcriptional regulator, LysR family [Azomonas agilis]
MDTLFLMRAFVCVAQTGSFTAAAIRMDLTTSYVSRAISALEDHLRTRLLHRTTRRIALTEAGQRYLQRCEQILGYIEEAEVEASEAHALPNGNLKIHSMTGIGHRYLIRAAAEYSTQYPEVHFDLTLANRLVDILEEGYDVSVVAARELPDSGYISKHLGKVYSVLCAAPSYLQQQGAPQQPSDLLQHQCLRLVYSVMSLDKWTLEGPNGQEEITIDHTHFQVNTVEAMGEAVKAGMGIGALPIYSAVQGIQEGRLVRVLPEYTLYPLGVFALYPSRQYLDAKIRTWLEFLREYLPKHLAQDEQLLLEYSQSSAPNAAVKSD